MAADGDLRDLYDPRVDEEKIAFILTMRAPPAILEHETSGLDCLVVVLRMIYAAIMLGPRCKARDPSFLETEGYNPVLRYAWDSFDFETAEEQKKARKEEILNDLKSFGDSSITDFRFKTLCLSELMTESFWGRTDLQLYRPRLFRPDEQSDFSSVEWDYLTGGVASLLQLNWSINPGQTIDELLDSSSVQITKAGSCEYRLFSRPSIIRILFTPGLPSASHSRPLFQDIRSITFPIGDFSKNEEGDTVYDREIRRERYALFAIVRMRNALDKRDYVRTYTNDGMHIIPELESSGCMNNDWSFNDPTDHQYMLFYAWCDVADLDDRWTEVQSIPPIDERSAARVQQPTDILKRYHETLALEKALAES